MNIAALCSGTPVMSEKLCVLSTHVTTHMQRASQVSFKASPIWHQMAVHYVYLTAPKHPAAVGRL